MESPWFPASHHPGEPHRGPPGFPVVPPFRPSCPSRGRRAQQRHLCPKSSAVAVGTWLQEEADVQCIAARGIGILRARADGAVFPPVIKRGWEICELKSFMEVFMAGKLVHEGWIVLFCHV